MGSTSLRVFCFLGILSLARVSHGGRIRRMVGMASISDDDNFSFPYAVSLRVRNNHFCSGALVTNKHVLTVARCVCDGADTSQGELQVRIGSSTPDEGWTYYRAESVVCHPDYSDRENGPPINDIAIIELEKRVELTIREYPVPLPSRIETDKELAKKDLYLSGWGVTECDKSDSARDADSPLPVANNVRYSQPIALEKALCQRVLSLDFENAILEFAQFCAIHPDKTGPSIGDYGSPVVDTNGLIGLFSWSPACAKGYPEVYTQVSKHREFINTVIPKRDREFPWSH